MKRILLTQKRYALVDDADYDELNSHKWCVNGNGYVSRRSKEKKIAVTMHRELLGVSDSAVQVDHINQNKLDNQRSNLRLVSRQENSMNRGRQVNNSSGYKGVHVHTQTGKWQAKLKLNNKHLYLGLFSDPVEAAKAYNVKAIECFGKYACLNAVS